MGISAKYYKRESCRNIKSIQILYWEYRKYLCYCHHNDGGLSTDFNSKNRVGGYHQLFLFTRKV
ncbi:hypothetical protein HLVA_07500 [Haliovirga abyssi]|uniref:Uncharacterized protein n=1 Tax=Haliovirga abyssi TaxID=2996794 RepID=A0AAU9D9B0_9FUSO|nr:hypothetical protein HLVA_07500 [Haliovirga abyssi]